MNVLLIAFTCSHWLLRISLVTGFLSTPSYASPWVASGSTSDAFSGRGIAGNDVSDIFSSSEIATMMQNADRLDSYMNKPDCFKRAANNIRVQCQYLETDEEERIQAAISMTLCEIATANHQLGPLECRSFESESQPPNVLSSDQSRRRCVEALSRSAQYWSSYSGYLREIPQLCYAFRRWNDIDTAHAVYRNSTTESLSLLRFLKSREQNFQKGQELVYEVLQNLRTTLDDWRPVPADVKQASEEGVSMMQSAQAQNMQLVAAKMEQFYQRLEDVLLQSSSAVASKIDTTIGQHAETLASLITSAEHSLTVQSSEVSIFMQGQRQSALEITSTINSHLLTLDIAFAEIHQATTELIAEAHRATQQLDVHIRDAHLAHETQLETQLSVRQLSDVVIELADYVNSEMENINNTVAVVTDRMLQKTQHVYDSELRAQLSAAALWIFKYVLRVDPVKFQSLPGFPVMRILSFAGHFIWWLFRTSFLAIISVIVLVTSGKRRSSIRSTRKPPHMSSRCAFPLVIKEALDQKLFQVRPGTLLPSHRSTIPTSDMHPCGHPLYPAIPRALHQSVLNIADMNSTSRESLTGSVLVLANLYCDFWNLPAVFITEVSCSRGTRTNSKKQDAQV